MARKPKTISISGIAREAGVSASAVSRVLHGRNGVSEEVRRKVAPFLRKHNFVSDYPLKNGKRIAVILGDACFGEYLDAVVGGIRRSLSRHNFSMTMFFKESGDGPSLLSQLREQQCSGAIILLAESSGRQLYELLDSELPVITIDCPLHDGKSGFVDHDISAGMYEAINHLVALGHRRIGYLKSATQFDSHIKRFKSYENAMRAAGIEPLPEWCDTPDDPGISTLPRGYQAARRLLLRNPGLTAVLATDDSMALSAMCAIHELGYRIPEDISIIGFDASKTSAYFNPPLTSIEHPMEEEGFLAMENLKQVLDTPGEGQMPKEILPTKLVIRKSTGPARTENIQKEIQFPQSI